MKTKILIVEDDGVIALRIRRLLDKWGYESNIANSYEAAKLAAETYRPELALMDIHLGDHQTDGIETALELRSRFNIPVVYLTAFADTELLERAKKTEPYGYLIKPIQELTLKTTLDIAIAKLQTDKRLLAALNEKDILMKEILHRTKNNMYMIVSLLSLQADRLQDKQLTCILKEIEHRVHAMLMVQEKLYRSSNFISLDLAQYLMELAYTVYQNMLAENEHIQLQIDLAPLCSSPDTAITCGLVLNELITNALKYAFPNERQGELAIAMNLTEQGEVELSVKDNGVGLPEHFNIHSTETLGLQLVAGFVRQLQGTLHIKNENGAEFFMRFPRQ
jgi:two-component sensor histidine kinase